MASGVPVLFSTNGFLRQNVVSPVIVKEPKHAKTIFKLVFVISTDSRTRARSLFAETEYELNQTYRQLEASDNAGGLLGFVNEMDAVIRENLARASSAHLQLPFAVAVVRAWNLDPRSIPRKHGAKLAYDYFCIRNLKDVPLPLRDELRAPSEGRSSSSGRMGLGPPMSPHSQPSLRRPRSASASGGGAAACSRLRPASALAPPRAARGAVVDSAGGLELQARLRRSAGSGLAVPSAGTCSRPSWSRVLAVGHNPPACATTLYALVGITPSGQARSLYGKEVAYDIGRSYRQVGVPYQEGGLHGFASAHAAVRNESATALTGCELPLAVAELRAWKLGMSAQMAVGQVPGKRIGLDFVRVERLLELPRELAAAVQGVRLWHASCGSGLASSLRGQSA